jgi:thiol-disulfide isomerase/thioredoxin
MPKRRHHKPSRWPQILAIGGLALFVVAVLVLKGKPQEVVPTAGAGDLPSVQLDHALADHQPTLAFFHSNNCQQCIDMMKIVEQVYPEFADSIVLVDVNVYDERNEPLLQQVGLQYIPTLIFYDRLGQSQVSVGVIEAEQLRQTLAALAEGD